VRASLPRQPGAPLPSPGTTIRAVEARGKHLLIEFGDDTWLHTHLRMHGSWHTYRHSRRWNTSSGNAVAILETRDVVAVCFSAPVVEVLTARDLERHVQLSSLGPDLCATEPDLDEALHRLSRLDPPIEIGVALLDQRVASGIGNVYKNEVLWACAVDPFASVGSLDHATRRSLLQTASVLLRRNLDGGRRTTYRGGLAVYDRAGQPCPRCGDGVRMQPQGEQHRITWWCTTCQPATTQAL